MYISYVYKRTVY